MRLALPFLRLLFLGLEPGFLDASAVPHNELPLLEAAPDPHCLTKLVSIAEKLVPLVVAHVEVRIVVAVQDNRIFQRWRRRCGP